MFKSKLVTKNLVNVICNNENYQVDSNHPNFKRIREAVLSNDSETFLELLNNNVPLAPLTQIPNVTIEHGQVKYKGNKISNEVAEDILDIYDQGYSVDSLVNFLEKLMQNPSKRAVDETYKFLKSLGLSICEDGDFLAYKCVSDNYLDKHSGTFSNHIGAVLEMERNQVDDNCHQTCSYGFHVGNLSYSGPGGSFHSGNDVTLIVKVNPKDVVSVPVDYNCGKCRVCRYEVIDHYKAPLENKVYNGSVNDNRAVPIEIDFNDIEVGKRYSLKEGDRTCEILVDHKRGDKIWGDILEEGDDGDYYGHIYEDDIYDIYEIG